MSIPGSANALLLASTAAAAGGYQIERSLRFNSSDSGFLSRTPAVAGNRRTWTWAGWVKRSAISGEVPLFHTPGNSNDSAYLRIYINSDQLSVTTFNSSGGIAIGVTTTQVFRDPSSWMHFVVVLDTTQATTSDRLKIYVNGSQVTQFSSFNWPTQNTDYGINTSGLIHYIGLRTEGTNYANGYLADIHFIDGQALTPSSFTEVSATTGQLIPKAYAGTYTGNSFWLKFNDNSSNTATTLGKDSFLLGNNWTPFNVSTSIGGPTSVAAASGALPVYNTTDTYGTVKGTGTRTDTYSSYISLALPMDGTNGGTSFGDQSAVIRGSGSAKTVTVTNPTTSTSQSKFYGSSGFFNNNGFLSIPYSSDVDLSGSGTDFTIETWIYRTTSDEDQIFEFRGNAGSTGLTLYVLSNNTIQVYDSSAGAQTASSGTISLNTWVHIAVTKNGSNCTYWINGVNAGTFTRSSFSATDATGVRFGGSKDPVPNAAYLSGYLQDLRIYKGVAKYTGNFNPPSSTANAAIAAGNDSLVDTPTSYGTDTGAGGEVRGNYCTWNPLAVTPSYQASSLTNGNLDAYVTGSNRNAYSTIAFPVSGKYFFEVTLDGSFSGAPIIGVSTFTGTSNAYPSSVTTPSVVYNWDGTKTVNGSTTAYGATYGAGAVIGVAVDIDSSTVTFYKNGSSQGLISLNVAGAMPHVGSAGATGTYSLNAGARPFAHTAPSGFKALCDTNLPAPVVAKPNTVMDVKLYTGNGSTQTISGLGFSPDWVWTKARSVGNSHAIWDAVRGVQKRLIPNDTVAESTRTEGLTAFTSDGFTHGNDATGNDSGTTYVAWCWDAGTSTVTNTQGSITSQVRANASAGFSVATWTGTGSGSATVGHGLGVAPRMMIVKDRSNARNWLVYHTTLGATSGIGLNSTNAASGADAGWWNNTSPTSTVATIGTYGNESANYVGYFWTPVVGYSSFGSYTGNGSADGPFVYTGFRPKWIMVKNTVGVNNWQIFDSARNQYNVVDRYLQPNASSAESMSDVLDIVSNGFKIRDSSGNWNGSTNPIIYAAFAENPFQYARAR